MINNISLFIYAHSLAFFINSNNSQINTSSKNLSSTLPSSPLIIMIVVVVIVIVVLLPPSISFLLFPVSIVFIIIVVIIIIAVILMNRVTDIQKIRSNCKGLQIITTFDRNMQRIRHSLSLPFLILLILLVPALRFLRI